MNGKKGLKPAMEKGELLSMLNNTMKQEARTSSSVLNIKNKQTHTASQPSRKRLSEVEYADVKRRRKERDLLRKEWPKVFVNKVGETGNLIIDGKRVPLYMGDIQNLLLILCLGQETSAHSRCFTIKDSAKASHVVMVHIEGLGLNDIRHSEQLQSGESRINEAVNHGQQAENSTTNQKPMNSRRGLPEWLNKALPLTSLNMHLGLEVVAPSVFGMCPQKELLQMKCLGNKTVKEEMMEYVERIQREDESMNHVTTPTESFFQGLYKVSSDLDDKLNSKDNYSRRKLLLRIEDFLRNIYPLPVSGGSYNKNSDFVLTSDNYKQVTSCSPMFGLDCEMCLTSENKLELSSISVVNEKHEVVYHTLVLPYNRIVNFMTKYSGITREMLHNVTKRLENVQEDLRNLLPPDAILVGHSLQSDLRTLKMMHPYIIDSSIAYNLSGMSNRPSSLKTLSEVFLGQIIQVDEKGHDPTEDAIASLKLIQLKLKYDENYGNVTKGWYFPSAASSNWQEVQVVKHSDQKQQSNSQQDLCDQNNKSNCQPEEQSNKKNVSLKKVTGPYLKLDTCIFQIMKSISIAIVMTRGRINSCLSLMLPLSKVPTIEVLTGNKQVSRSAATFASSKTLTFANMEMGRKLSQCVNEASRRRQIRKLDKRLRRIHKAAPPKSVLIYLFSGSSMTVPTAERSNGFVLVGIKDIPFRT